MKGSIETAIEGSLLKLKPSLLIIENESHKHKSRGEQESHFKVFFSFFFFSLFLLSLQVLVVSEAFKDLSLIDRHRLVNETVSNNGILPCHALSIKALTPDQFSSKPDIVDTFSTPPCLGGEKLLKKKE